MAMTATKTCEHCGAIYPRHRSYSRKQWATSRFCSRQCQGKSITGVKTGPKPEIRIGREIPCAECGKRFYAAPWAIKRRGGNKFCSKACAYMGRELKATFAIGHSDIVPKEARRRAGAKASIFANGQEVIARAPGEDRPCKCWPEAFCGTHQKGSAAARYVFS